MRTTTHKKPITISASQGFCTKALFAGLRSGVRMISYRPEWMRPEQGTNVVPLHRPTPPRAAHSLLILPLPANDNFA